MAATAARDLLSVTHTLLDHSEEVWDVTRRFVKHAETRKAHGDMADLKFALHSGAVESATRPLLAPGSKIASDLAGAARDCAEASSAFTSLASMREAVVSARMEALNAKDEEIMISRKAIREESASRKAALDADFTTALRALKVPGTQ
jgi:hypothetical protein